MEKRISDVKINLKQPWLLALLFAASIPAFPEYLAPILAACSLAAAFIDAKNHRRYITIGTLGKLILIYIAYMAVGLLYSLHKLSTLSTVGMWAVMFMVYLAMTTVLSNRHRFDTALFSISIIAGIIGAIGIFQYAIRIVGINIPLQFWKFADDIVFQWLPLTLLPGSDVLRVSSTFNNPNILAEYLVMVIPFIIYYSFSGKRTGTRLFCRVCLLAAVCSVLFTFSRGCYLALLVVAFIFCVAYRDKITIIIMSLASIFLLIPDSVITRLCSLSRADRSINERLDIWKYGIHKIGENPLLGIGAGVYNTWDMLLHGGINAPHMHNIILQLLAEGGLIALAIMSMAAWKMFRSSHQMLHHESDETRRMGVVLLAFLAAFFIDGLVDFPLLTPKLVGVFLMVLAFVDSAAKIYLGREIYPLRELLPYTRRYVSNPNTAKYTVTKSQIFQKKS